MKILYVGFKGKNNASFRLVSAFDGERLFLTNSFEGLKRDIDALSLDYDTVYMFGIDPNLSSSVRIETCAELTDHLLKANLPAAKIAAKLRRNGIAVNISDKPTHYLCNAAYYRMLEKYGGNVIFIHIPSMKHITDEMIRGIIQSIGE